MESGRSVWISNLDTAGAQHLRYGERVKAGRLCWVAEITYREVTGGRQRADRRRLARWRHQSADGLVRKGGSLRDVWWQPELCVEGAGAALVRIDLMNEGAVQSLEKLIRGDRVCWALLDRRKSRPID